MDAVATVVLYGRINPGWSASAFLRPILDNTACLHQPPLTIDLDLRLYTGFQAGQRGAPLVAGRRKQSRDAIVPRMSHDAPRQSLRAANASRHPLLDWAGRHDDAPSEIVSNVPITSSILRIHLVAVLAQWTTSR